MATNSENSEPGKSRIENPSQLSEADWKKRLTPQQYYICRQKGTEMPGTGKYLYHKEKGVYACVACGQELFKSETKLESSDWPSFYEAIAGTVRIEPDLEAVCTRCGSHLGHCFNDGPPPTGKRY